MNEGNNTSKKKVSKNLIWALISLVLAVITIRVVLKQSEDISVSDLINVVRNSDKLFFSLSVAASFLFVWFEGVAIRSILKHSGYNRKPLQGLMYSTSDIYFSAITPSATGGQPASAFFMIKDGIPAGIVTATLVLNLMMYTISIIVLGIIAIILDPGAFFGFSTLSKTFIAIGFAVMLLLAACFFVLLKKESLLFKPLTKIIDFLHRKRIIKEKEHLLAKINKTSSDYRSCSELISGHSSLLFWAFIWNILQRASQIIVPVFVFVATGGAKDLMASVFSRQCLITIGYNFVPIPGGMGISDYLMIDGFCSIMEESVAYSVELISRGITFYICVTISGIITLVGYLIGKHLGGRSE